MGRTLDITGKKFNRVIALSKSTTKSNAGKIIWNCECECGKVFQAIGSSLISGNTKSCGCWNLENITKHGDSSKRFYSIWKGMIRRCTNPNSKAYKYYGAKGVKVCKSWLNYTNFKKDMLSGYRDDLTLDRIKVKGNYSPKNCRWATLEQQANNTSTNVFIDSPWGRLTIAQTARKMGVSKDCLWNRIKRNWPVEKLFLPSQRNTVCN